MPKEVIINLSGTQVVLLSEEMGEGWREVTNEQGVTDPRLHGELIETIRGEEVKRMSVLVLIDSDAGDGPEFKRHHDHLLNPSKPGKKGKRRRHQVNQSIRGSKAKRKRRR